MSLANKFIKSTKLKGAGKFSEIVEKPKPVWDTGIYALNLAYSGSLFGGTREGLSSIAGKSKSFKTLFGLISAKAYLDANPGSFMLFYDSEGGASKDYFEQVGIDPNRVIYIPIMNVEELKFDLISKFEEIKNQHDEAKKGEPTDKFVVFVDSIGNLASIKEVKDALSDNPAADMGTRAKALKAFFRIATPYLSRCEMHMVAIQHTYDEMASMGAPKQIMSGGTGGMYSSNDVFIVGKRQIKEGSKVIGWQFILNVEKSRVIREKAAIPFDVIYGEGINKYSGLLDMALASGHVTAPKQGWYTRPGVEGDKNWRRKESSTADFWDPILKDPTFDEAIKQMYCLTGGNKLLQNSIDEVLGLEPGEKVDEETGEILPIE
jgi:RecA/RadA recombinase